MKKRPFYSYLLIVWMTVCVSTVQAAEFSVIDSDGDVYHIGRFLGYELDNQKYYVQFINDSSGIPSGNGILFYDDRFQSMKLVIFESNSILGFTLEGYWQGSGSSVFYMDGSGRSAGINLFLGDRPRSRSAKTPAVKQINK